MHGTASRPSTTSRSPRMRDVPDQMADRLIVALDVPTPDQAESLVNDLDGVVSFYKIGLWLLFTAGTDQLIDRLISKGKKIFLDYKMFDIPETVSKGVTSARDRGIKHFRPEREGELDLARIERFVHARNAPALIKIDDPVGQHFRMHPEVARTGFE